MNEEIVGKVRKSLLKSSIQVLLVLLLLLSIFIFCAFKFGNFSGQNFKNIYLSAIILEIIFLAALSMLIFYFFLSIKVVNVNAEKLAHGQLNIDDILIEKTRGLEVLTIAFNDMKTNLLSFIESTKINMITLSDAIDTVSSSIDRTYTGNEHIATSMMTVSEKAQEQVKFVNDTIKGIDEMSRSIINISNSIEEVGKSVNKTAHATNEGVLHLDEFYQKMNIISDNLSNTSEYIIKLNSEISQIDGVGKIIIQISEQLKLLALNASVEAARAGEAGKGFSVVAHEMNMLSLSTKQSIGQINSILKNISSSSQFVSKSINSSIENYSISLNAFKSIKDSFYTIDNNAGILESDMKNVSNDVSLINSNIQIMNEMGLNLYNSSNEISSKTEEVAAVTQEELAELEEVSKQTASLQNMLSGIENLVRRFRTAVFPVDKNSSKQLKITFISPLDHEFWYGVRQGVLYAKKELAKKNVVIDYIGFQQNTNDKIVNAFKEAMQNGSNGIVLPGFTNEIVPLIDEAFKKGIPVMLFNCDLTVESKRTSYFGPDVNTSGTLAAKLMVKSLKGKGNVAILRGGFHVATHKTRRETIVKELSKSKKIKLAEEIEAADNSELLYNTVKDLLKRNPSVEGILITGGGVAGAAKAIEELGFIGKTRIVCFDFSKEIYELIKKDIIYAAIGQDPFGQGHDPVVYLYNSLVTGQKPDREIIWTRLDVVDKNNVNDLL